MSLDMFSNVDVFELSRGADWISTIAFVAVSLSLSLSLSLSFSLSLSLPLSLRSPSLSISPSAPTLPDPVAAAETKSVPRCCHCIVEGCCRHLALLAFSLAGLALASPAIPPARPPQDAEAHPTLPPWL